MEHGFTKLIEAHKGKCLKRLQESTSVKMPVLVLASYCDNDTCTDLNPCDGCIRMSNIALVERNKLDVVCSMEFLNDEINE